MSKPTTTMTVDDSSEFRVSDVITVYNDPDRPRWFFWRWLWYAAVVPLSRKTARNRPDHHTVASVTAGTLTLETSTRLYKRLPSRDS